MTSPPDVRGIYDTWAEVEKLLRGRPLCQMKVYGREDFDKAFHLEIVC